MAFLTHRDARRIKFFWDNGGVAGTSESYGLVDRSSLSWNLQGTDVALAIMKAYSDG
ncbi:MAG: hypothetical protein LKG48_11255 [Lachnospiraceae bacterium]|jgi:hypothetical protein|nr:hypothetical protein [Lachnospiraceae bacterium]MCI1334752.1 hypothetical protein [Lachnospiraceae bacterium]MCI1358844.1 hypothetical protein [Lachnospiraceae bacterium]